MRTEPEKAERRDERVLLVCDRDQVPAAAVVLVDTATTVGAGPRDTRREGTNKSIKQEMASIATAVCASVKAPAASDPSLTV